MQVKLEGLEQGLGPHPFHTPVSYLLEGSCSIPVLYICEYLNIYIYILYYIITSKYIYIYQNKYTNMWTCVSLLCICTHIHERTHTHTHTWVHTCANTFSVPKPRDCVGNSVRVALTAATYFATAVLCDGRAVLGCCQLEIQKWIACSRSVPAPLAVAACWGTAVLCDGRDALGCCQLAV